MVGDRIDFFVSHAGAIALQAPAGQTRRLATGCAAELTATVTATSHDHRHTTTVVRAVVAHHYLDVCHT
jgi:hypothetical protein